MMHRQRAGIRLVHHPTGLSVTLSCLRNSHLPRLEQVARRILKSKLARPIEPERPVRTYTLQPDWASGVRQGETRLTPFGAPIDPVFDGQIPWLPSPR